MPKSAKDGLEAELFADLLMPDKPANDDLLVPVYEEDIDTADIFVVEEDVVADPPLAANDESFVLAHENMFEGGALGLPAEDEFFDAVAKLGHGSSK